ncbi:hypothetical protein CORT_0E04360 [Candida orthopsilosis Co 90-125]|uniref:F-box domain-containing protein n=1 Tax=Candida orthopsilosis (strain 90-125) TaxID=1136231 RepID=H8X794_CANO9|nr:hypothetical protein CORT_0E04360 [Candida orthopsilosis Co 90-125]CCG24023.1 hypothetical protein CORT_0E04360 [Candida orthopsilosis Co 90-125]
MVSLAGLPDHALQLVFNNINQHQAIALAPLHSKLYFTAKRKLYYYIYVYDIKGDERLAGEIGRSSVTCALPDFRFPCYLNNRTTNKCTIVSVKTVSKYLKQMDPNQPLSHLVFQHTHVSLFDKIIKHFKSIKYFIVNYLNVHRYNSKCYNSTFGRYRVFDQSSNITALHERFHIIGDTCLYTHESSAVTCWVTESYWDSSLHYKNVYERIEVDITRPSKMRKLHVVVSGQNESLFKITQVYNTFLLCELFITCFTYLDTFFTNFQLDADYPSLIVLGLSQRVVFMLDKMKGKRITQLSHQTVRHVIIGTDFVTEKVAKEVCELSLQFPKASINWSSALLCADNMAYLIEQIFRFSHVMPKGFIGILWTPKSIKYMEPIQSKYLVGEKDNEHTVELVKYYSNTELMHLMTIYRGKNCLYYY